MANKQIFLNQLFLYFIVFMAFAFTNTQVIPFLTSIGYTPIERGIILSTVAIVAILAQFYIGYLCDKYNTIKRFYHLLMFGYVLINALMYLFTTHVFFVHLLLVSLNLGLYQVVSGLIETWTIETNEYIKQNFGSIRALGSIGWALGAPLTSWIIKSFGYQYIGLAFAIIILSSFAISYKTPDAQKIEKNVNLKFSDVKVLLHNKKYVTLVILLIVVNFVFRADSFTVIDKMIAIGGTNDQIAFKWSFQAIVEVPLFFLGFYLLKHFKTKHLLITSIIMLMLRFLLNTLATTPNQIIWISAMQMVSFPLLLIAQKILIAEEAPLNLQSSAQMFALSMYTGIPALLTPLISGILVQSFGFNFTLLIMMLTLIIALYLAFSYTKLK